MKKLIALFLALTACASCFYGCSADKKNENEEKTERKQSVKETTGMDKFEITYYCGPSCEEALDENFWQKISECGFTTAPLYCASVEDNKTALALMKKYGITCSAFTEFRISPMVGDSSYTKEQIDETVKTVVADYADCDNLVGWNIIDEPQAEEFSNLAMIVDAFRRFDPDRNTCINLFPNYATDEQLGTDGYEEYLEKFVSEVKPDYISYDHYHFLSNGTKRDTFFTNFEAIRNISLENKLDYMLIILLTKHMGYTDVTYEQLNWEVNMSLAYGAKSVSYFTFYLSQGLLDDGWTNACMSYTGEVYPHYYDVQKINKTLINIGNELFDKNSTGVYHISTDIEDGCKIYNAASCKLGKINGMNFTVGVFDDDSFMIVNEEYEGMENSFTLADVTEGLEYFDSEANEWKPYETRNGSGLYLFRLDPGAAVLIRTAE